MKLQKEITVDEEERNCLFKRLSELQAHIIHKRKMLDQALCQFKEQINCLIHKIKENDEIMI